MIQKIAALLFVCLLAPVWAFAQSYPEPASAGEPAVLCTGCPGTNAAGETNEGKPLYPYNVPVVDHVGRVVDSWLTQNVQNAGMRTLRARTVRVRPSRDRIYVQLGETIAAYTLSTFFTSRLAQPMVSVQTINTGSTYNRYSSPYETLAKPDAHFYAESKYSGWKTLLLDQQAVLKDYDTDDRGYLYISTVSFGWGIQFDDGRTDGTHLPFVSQVPDTKGPDILFTLKHGDEYTLVMSGPDQTGIQTSARFYNVTNPSSVTTRSRPVDTTGGFKRWSKFEAGQRVAVISGDGSLRIFTNAGMAAGSEPLATYAPSAGKKLEDLSFDDEGNLWVAESTVTPAANVLWKLTPSAAAPTYTRTTHDVYGSVFAPQQIHASAGYVGVGGRGPDPADATDASDVRLFDASTGTPQLLPTDNYFRRYYHRAPAGFAQPKAELNRVSFRGLHVVRQNGLDYLIYSAEALGDVYELGDALRPPQLKVNAISPTTGLPAGGTVVTIHGRNFGQDSTAKFGNTVASTTFVDSFKLTAVAPKGTGSVDVSVASAGQFATAPMQYSYVLPPPSNLVAKATSTTSVTMTWTASAGATKYEIWRYSGSSFVAIGTANVLTFTDSGLTPGNAYVYRVHAMDADDNRSAASLRDIATTMQFTDATITAGLRIKAAHLLELCQAVNLVRAAAGMSPATFTGTIGPGAVVKAVHVSELRNAVQPAANFFGIITPFTDADLPGVRIKALHLQELRNIVQ